MSQVNISIFDLLIENQEKSNFESTTNEIENNNEINDDQNQKNILNNNEDDLFRSSSVDYFRTSNAFETLLLNEKTNLQKTKMTSKNNFNENDFEILSRLGNGAYAEVFKAKHKKTSQLYAIKIIDKKLIEKENKTYQIFVENEMLNLCNHPNIISIYGYYEDCDNFFIVEEYCKKGDLSEFMINNLNKLSIEEIKFIISQIVLCLEYLGSLNIIHRDIKPENFMIDKNFTLKLIDFGTATFKGKILDEDSYQYIDENKFIGNSPFSESFNSISLNENDKIKNNFDNNIEPSNYNMKSYIMKKNIKLPFFEFNDDLNQMEIVKKQKFVGTSEYMPPETIKNNFPIGEYSDIWSLAIILFQILTGNTPFRDKSDYLIFQNILNGKFNDETIYNIDENAANLIENILLVDPKKRLGYDHNCGYNYNVLKNHPFFKIDSKFDINKIRNQLLIKTLYNKKNSFNKSGSNSDNTILNLLKNQNKNEKNEVNNSNTSLNSMGSNFSQDPSDGHILKKGLLKKRSPYFFYNLRKVILYDTPRLDYIDPDTKKVKGSIMLDKTCSAELIKNNQFLLKTPNRTFSFMCKDKYDISPWVNLINDAIKRFSK
jgi:3-phosphoinositide dependent protein kinase-1